MRRGRWTTAGLAVALLLGPAAPAVAQTVTTAPIGEQIQSARKSASDASAEEARILAGIDASNARKHSLELQVADLDGQVAAAQNAVDAAEAALAGFEAQEQAAAGRLADAQAALVVAKAELARQAIAAYTGRSQAAQYLDVALRSRDMAELVAKRLYIKAVAGSQTEAIAATERLRNEVADLRDKLSSTRAAAQAQRDVVAARQSKVVSQRDAQAAVVAQVADEISQGNELRAQAQSRKDEFEAKADALQAQSDVVAAQLRQRAQSAPAPAATPSATPATPSGPAAAGASPGASSPSGGGGPTTTAAPARTGKLATPVPGAPITSPFGYRTHPIYGTVRLHTGVDFGAPEGTPIHAAEAGTVVSAGWMTGYGNTTVIDHGNGLATLYAHQSSIGVSAGQQVSRNQVIGAVGCTGDCTGPHLHFEVRVNGTPVDPMGYL